MSKKTVFGPAQNAALRSVLAGIEQAGRSQADIGRELGIAQQNVARLLRDERAGFAYTTASLLVRLAGFEGVDAFFAEKGVPVLAPISEASLSELDDSAIHARAG